MLTPRRFGIFLAVGWLGFAVQLAALALLMSLAGWSWLPATLVSVELAVVHNFLWHERVTWRDRPAFAAVARFVRFNAATGVTSIAGNVALMAVYVGVLRVPPLVANVFAVITMSVVNFFVADRWVFHTGAVVAMLLIAAPAAADLRVGPYDAPRTVAAWNQYVAETEARLESARPVARGADSLDIEAEGKTIGVERGTISHWRGSVFVSNITLDDVLRRLQYPGTPPPQEDVVWSRVIGRGHDSLRVFIRLVRRALVTATYDTEHEMTFRRLSPALATARSVATRIEETDGGDRGFLWRLNSYWRYEQADGGVRVNLESLTLSRDVPAIIRPVASPIVTRIARESVVRTLEALRTYLGS